MAIALVKAGAAANSTGSSASPAPSFGQATTSGNLLIAWVTCITASSAGGNFTCSDGTWSRATQDVANANALTAIFYKANCGTGETAPTFTYSSKGIQTNMWAALAEFSAAGTLSPLDQVGSTNGATSPLSVAAASTDSASAELVITVDSFRLSIGATSTTADSYNNGATPTTNLNNDSTSTSSHYRFAWGLTNGNSVADTNSVTESGGSLSRISGSIVSFSGPAGPTNIGEPTIIAPDGFQVSKTVIAYTGNWTPTPTSFAYQWQNSSDLVTWTNIGGATASVYTLTSASDNKYVRCRVSATNVGTTTASSNWLGPLLELGPVCQIAFASNPGDASYVWTDVTPYLLSGGSDRSKQRLLQRFDAGTASVVLQNTDRRFDPSYTGSPYYPNVLPMKPFRLGVVLNGVTNWEFTGYVERWPQSYPGGPNWAETDITATDGFLFLSNTAMSSAAATLSTNNGGNSDITLTALSLGTFGNTITLTINAGNGGGGADKVTIVTVSGTDITVGAALDAQHTNIVETASGVMSAINALPAAAALVTASLKSGQNGTGTISTLAKTSLAGGTFVQQYTGQYISAILSSVGWTGSTSISTGLDQVQSQVFANDGQTNALDQINLATQTENGQFFFNVNGVPTFYSRSDLAGTTLNTPQVILSDYPDNVTTFGYQNITIDWDTDLIYNDVRGSILGASSTDIFSASDSTSQTEYFKRTLSLDGILSISDSVAANLASGLVWLYKQPSLRYEPLVLRPGNNFAFWQSILSLDLMEQVTIYRTPPGGGSPITDNVQVIGIQFDLPKGPLTNATVTLSIDPSGVSGKFLVLDDPTQGAMDSVYQLGF